MTILTKYHKDWAKIVELLLIAIFFLSAIFFTQTLYEMSIQNFEIFLI